MHRLLQFTVGAHARVCELGSTGVLQKLIRRHHSAAVGPISMKFGRLMQNNMPIMKTWSTLKTLTRVPIWPTLIFQTGSSYLNGALRCVVAIRFADNCWLLKTMTSLNPKPEVVLRHRSNCDEFQNERNNHITVIGVLFCISLPNDILIGPLAAE